MSKVSDLTVHHFRVTFEWCTCEYQYMGWVNLTSFYFVGMDCFSRFDMVVEASFLLKIWHNDLDRDHKRTLNKYMGVLTEFINMSGWPELIEVLIGYWDNERIVFRFGTVEITPTIEKIQDCIDTVGTGLERRVRKDEDIFVPNKPSIENIADWLGFEKYFVYWCQESNITFRDIYVMFGHSNFYTKYNQEFKVSYREWNEIRPLAFAIALLATMIFPHRSSLSIKTRVITFAHTLFKGYKNQGQVKYYPIALVILSDIEPWESPRKGITISKGVIYSFSGGFWVT